MRKLVTVCVLAGVAIGTAGGLGAFTFFYARGYSYVTNDPTACANCHVMRNHYNAWTRSHTNMTTGPRLGESGHEGGATHDGHAR